MRAGLVLPLLLLLAAAPARAAETAYLYDSTGSTLRVVALDGVGTAFGGPLRVTGLGGGDVIAAIDVRPGDGALYALTVNTAANPDRAELYRLEIGADAASAVSVGRPGFTPSGSLGMAFDPRTGDLRVVGSNGLNLRLDPGTAAVTGTDGPPSFAPGDANEGEPAALSSVAAARGEALVIAGTAEKLLARLSGDQLFTLGPTGVSAGVGADSLVVSPADGAIWWLRTGYFRADAWRVDPQTGSAQAGIPFDFSATAMALLPASTIFLAATRAGGYGEAEGAAVLRVTRSGPATGETRVPYVVESGTADVEPVSGSILFADGERERELRVPIPQDTAVEGREFFTVRLGDPQGNRTAGAVIGSGTLTVAVDDDDVAAPGTTATLPGADRSPPTLRLTRVPQRTLKRSELLRGFTVRVLPSETVSLTVSLRANPRRRAVTSAYELALFARHFPRSPFTRSVRVRPARRLVGRLKRRTRLRLVVEATDVAGNRRVATRTISVRG